MTNLLQQAITKMQALPDVEQDAIATVILEELADEQRWHAAFARSQDELSNWASKVRQDIQSGRIRKAGIDEL